MTYQQRLDELSLDLYLLQMEKVMSEPVVLKNSQQEIMHKAEELQQEVLVTALEGMAESVSQVRNLWRNATRRINLGLELALMGMVDEMTQQAFDQIGEQRSKLEARLAKSKNEKDKQYCQQRIKLLDHRENELITRMVESSGGKLLEVKDEA